MLHYQYVCSCKHQQPFNIDPDLMFVQSSLQIGIKGQGQFNILQ